MIQLINRYHLRLLFRISVTPRSYQRRSRVVDSRSLRRERGDGTRCSYNEEVSNLTLLRLVLSSPHPSRHRLIVSSYHFPSRAVICDLIVQRWFI